MFHVKQSPSRSDRSVLPRDASGCLDHCSPKQPGRIRPEFRTELEHLDVLQAMAADDGRRGGDLVRDTGALEEEQLTAGPHERSRDRNELRERADRTGRHLVEGAHRGGVLRASAHNRDIAQTEALGLRAQPLGTTLHRLDQHEVNVGASDREHKSRQPCTAADIGNPRPVAQQGRNEAGVDHVTRPQPCGLQRADQAEFLTELGEVTSESTREIESITEYG